MGDPVSWLEVQPGWKALAAGGEQIGEVDEVVGDPSADIFDGLAIATSALGDTRYVPAEQVATIEDGAVQLSITSEQAAALGAYREPAESIEIEPDDPGTLARVEGELRELKEDVIPPADAHEHRAGIFTRVRHWLRRQRG